MSWPAKYPGRCPACEERIHEDDPVKWADDGTVVHADCEATTSPAHPHLLPGVTVRPGEPDHRRSL